MLEAVTSVIGAFSACIFLAHAIDALGQEAAAGRK
jgi:hypothetical protein